MYLPKEMPSAKVLMTVKTYPRPTPTYEEIVCSAGFLETGQWIRIYPIPFRELPYERQFKKFAWIKLDLVKDERDFRRESYKPKRMFDEEITAMGDIGTKKEWLERKRLVLQEVFTSMQELINLAYDEDKSLAVMKPREIIDFIIEEDTEREWSKNLTRQLNQMKLFETTQEGIGKTRSIVKKLPYRYYYRFVTEGDKAPRKLQIFDWEIGALYWNCLRQRDDDENKANELVKQKYYDEFVNMKDLHLFLGTTYTHHRKKADNPFTIVGVFAPPKTLQPPLPL